MSEIATSAEMPQDENTPQTTPERDQLAQIAALLQGEEPAPEEGASPAEKPTDKPGEANDKAPPKTLKDVAERLGIDVAELYKLEFGMPETGERHTLGELKDMLAERSAHTVEQLRWAEQKAQQESELLRARAELTELMAALPPQALKPEVISKVREKHEATVARERELTLQVIPEWQDEELRTAELTGMAKHLMEYGFPADYLKQVSDHRTMRYIRENYKREQRIRRALEKVQKVAPKTPAPSRPSGPAPKPRGNAGKAGGDQAKVQAISELLKGR